MYISKIKITTSKLLVSFALFIGIFFVFIGVMGTFIEIGSIADNERDFQGLAIGIGLVLFFASLSLLCIRKLKLIGTALEFNSIFENDEDGEIPIQKIVNIWNMPQRKVVKLFNKSVNSGYLVNCSIDYNNELKILLNNGGKSVKEKFEVINCPVCGGTNRIKKGFISECEFCHSKIEYK